MAVSYDNQSSTSGTATNNLSWSHTASGSDRAGLIAIGHSAAAPGTVSTWTYGGSATGITELWDFSAQTYFGNGGAVIVAPATGAQTVQVTLSGTNDELCAGIVTLNGVHQTTPTGTANTNSGSGGSNTVNITSVSDEIVVDFTYCWSTTIAADASQTMRWERESINSATAGGMSTETATGTSTTMSWTRGGTDNNSWTIGGVAFKPTGGGGGGPQSTGYLDPVSAYSISAGLGAVRPWEPGLGGPGTLVCGVNLSDDVKVHISDVSTNATQFPLFALFSANIATGSEVLGFNVRYERRGNAAVTAAGASERWLRLVSGAGTGVEYVSTTVNANTGAWTTTDTYVTAGGDTEMWGMTTADASSGRINSTRFGVAIRANYAGGTVTSAAMSIDHIQLQIRYRPPSSNAEIFSAEFDRENSSVATRLNIVAQSSEYDNAVQSMGVSALCLVGPQSGEFEYEAVQVDIQEIGVPVDADVKSAEFDLEAQSLPLTINVAVQSAEHDREFYSLALALDARPQTPEYDHEASQVALAANLNPVGAEFGYEAAQTDVQQVAGVIDIDVKTAEFDYEDTSPALVLGIAAQSAEHDREIGLAGLTSLAFVGVQSAEFDHEATTPALVLDVSVQSAEHDREIELAGVTSLAPVGVQPAEFDFEGGSVLLAVNVVPDSAEFDTEAASISLTQLHVLGVESAEYGAEIASVGLGANVIPLPAEFEGEIGSAGLVGNVTVHGFEGDHESGSVLIAQVALAVDEVETGYESGEAGLALNLVVEGAEFSRDFGSPNVTSELLVVPAEFDFETLGPEFGYVHNAQGQDTGWDSGSPSLGLSYFLGVSSLEFDRDWGEEVPYIRNRMDWLRLIEGKIHRERELRRRKWA